MPTFFSKILNLGKDKDKKGDNGTKEPQSPTSPKSGKRQSIHSLLEGKFEAVSPTVSEQGGNAGKEKEAKGTAESDSDKDKVTLLSKPKSRTKSPTRRSDDFPRLTLNLTLPNASANEKKDGVRELRTVLEGTVDGAPLLDDATLGETRLSPSDALKLMKACAGVINERGLDTLGVMHPHWHSASPQLQRRLISLFMASIDQSSSSSPKAQSAFEDGMEFTRSPHDIASVFRWALRHLQLEGHSFASAKDEKVSTTGSLSWYDSFANEERTGDFPQSAFTSLLLPRVKPPHVDLLFLTTDLMSVLAAHSETNGVSGSKLSMILGQYLLIGTQEDGELSWKEFYEKWENSGRALEHIFLCYLRDATSKNKIPKRVTELVAGYPYSKHAIEGESRFPRPAGFATRSYDALHILITCEVPVQSKFREENAYPIPLSVIENALKSAEPEDKKALEQAWNRIKELANTVEEQQELLEGKAQDQRNLLSRVLSDESIRLLGLRTDDVQRVNKSTPTITMFSHVPGEARVYSVSNSVANGTDVPNGKGKESVNGISRNASETTATSTTLGGPTPITPVTADWGAFSSSGFGEDVLGSSLASTLMDTDVEKTQPAALESRRSLKKSGSKGHKGERAKSRERVGRRTNVTPLAASEVSASEPTSSVPSWKTASVTIVKLDEAFVDFWADALLDPIARPWPTFVVCQLKSNVSVEVEEGQKITWLVVEQAFVTPPPPPPVEEEHFVQRASSPKPSVASDTKRPGPVGRVSSTFKRFALFGSGSSYTDDKDGGKKAGKGIRVGEMGEIIHEEPSSPPTSPVRPTASNKEEKRESALKEGSSDKKVATAAAIAVGGVAVASALNETGESLKSEPEAKVESIEPAKEEEIPNEPASQSAAPDSSKAVEAQTAAATTEELASQPATQLELKVESDAPPTLEPEQGISTSVEDVAPTSDVVGPNGDRGLIKEEELAEEAATRTLADASTTEAAVEAEKSEDRSQPERAVVGDESAGETTAVQALEAPTKPPRSQSPGAGESRFVEHLESTPDIAEHAAPLDTVEEVAAVHEVAEQTNEAAVIPAEAIRVDAPVSEATVPEQEEIEVKESAVEAVEIPEAAAVPESVAEEPIREAAAVEEPATEEPVIVEPPVTEAAPVEEPVAAAEPSAVEPTVEATLVEEPVTDLSTVDEPVSVGLASEAHVAADAPKTEELAAVEEPVTETIPTDGQIVDVPASEVVEAEETTIPEPNLDEPVAEAPIADEPVVQEAVPEQFAAEHSPVDEDVSTQPTTEAPADEGSIIEDPAVKESDAEEQIAQAPTGEEVSESPAVNEPIPEATAVEESPIEEQAVEEQTIEAPVVDNTPVVAVEKPVADEPSVENPVVEEPPAELSTVEKPITEELSVEEPANESAVEDSTAAEPAEAPPAADEPSSRAAPENAEAVEVSVETAPQESGNESVAHDPEALATTALETAESAPELLEASSPVVAAEVEATIHPEVPIIEDITTGSPEGEAEPAPAEDVTSNLGLTVDATQPSGSEHVESEPAESTGVASDEVPPVDATKEQPSEPPAVEPISETVHDEGQTS